MIFLSLKVRHVSDRETNTVVLTSGERGRELAEMLAQSRRVMVLECQNDTSQVFLSSPGDGAGSIASGPVDPANAETTFASLVQAVPRMDTLVVMPPMADLQERSGECSHFVSLFEEHFFRLLAGIKSVLPRMVSTRKGAIIVILPASALETRPQASAAFCAHWALRRVCQSLRVEMESYEVGVYVMFTSLREAPGADKRSDGAGELKRLCSAITRRERENAGPGRSLRLRDRSRHLIEQLFPDRRLWLKSANGNGHRRPRPKEGFHTILITGASSGLGRDLTRLYARAAQRICLVGRDRTALRQLREELAPMHTCTIDVAGVDLGDLEAVSDYADAMEGVDMLVNCAGFSVVGAVQDVSLEWFRKNMTVNFLAPVLLTEAFLRKEPVPQCIVNVLSTTAIAGRRKQASYSASKAALWAYTRMCRQTAPAGTTVIEVLPATFASGFAAHTVAVESDRKPTNLASSSGRNRHGLTSETVAAKVYQASMRGRRRVFIPHKAKLFHLLEATSPRLFQRMFP